MIYLEALHSKWLIIESRHFIMLEFAAMSEPLYLAKSEDELACCRSWPTATA
jgi:hypothetical protein